MATLITVPRLGHLTLPARIGNWYKNEGDTVAAGEPLFDIEADKAVVEVTSPCTGTLLKIVAAAGSVTADWSVAAVVGTPGEPIPDLAKPTTPSPPGYGQGPLAEPETVPGGLPQEMSRVRRVISRRLQQSKHQTPHFYLTVRVDMTELIALRRRLRQQRCSVSLNDFIIKAVALTLVEHPMANANTVDGIHLHYNDHVNIGMAVNVEAGVLVPVVHSADRLSVREIHRRTKELIGKAQQRRLAPFDMQGGTFTVTNMGMLNVDEFTAIINPGESAIIAVSSIVPTPVVNDTGQIVVRDLMRITMSSDHRVIDGALAAVFANSVKRKLEDPAFWAPHLGDDSRSVPGKALGADR